MEKSGDKRSALLVLRPFIQNKTAGTGIYKEYVKLLKQEGKTNEVRLILKSADREVQNACAEYICETPVSNPAPGTYTTTTYFLLITSLSMFLSFTPKALI